MKITRRMKNELRRFGCTDTKNYRYVLFIYYGRSGGSAYLKRISMKSVIRQTTDLIDGWEIIMDVDLNEDRWEVR